MPWMLLDFLWRRKNKPDLWGALMRALRETSFSHHNLATEEDAQDLITMVQSTEGDTDESGGESSEEEDSVSSDPTSGTDDNEDDEHYLPEPSAGGELIVQRQVKYQTVENTSCSHFQLSSHFGSLNDLFPMC